VQQQTQISEYSCFTLEGSLSLLASFEAYVVHSLSVSLIEVAIVDSQARR